MHSSSLTRDLPMSAVTPGEASLLEKYLALREASLQICSPLSVEDHSLQPMPDTSPAKWHLAHTTWFFETFLLGKHLPGYKPINPAFRNLFNSYYNTVGDRAVAGTATRFSRPALDEVREYRKHVDEAMAQLLKPELASDGLTRWLHSGSITSSSTRN